MENSLNPQRIDLSKYCKIKHINLRDSSTTGQRDLSCTFDISEYPEYDDVLEIRTVEQSISEYRGMYITIGKLKKESKQ